MPDSPEQPRRRIRTDPHFYTILGVIGGTYVLLIVAMLAADAAYIFTSDMTRPVSIGFSSYGDSELLKTGDLVSDQFSKYGLTISTDEETHPAVIVNSSRPSASNSDLGTPNIDFGGPGIGRGGQSGDDSSNLGTNDMPMGNVVTISSAGPPFNESNTGEAVVNWVKPVRVERVTILQLPVVGILKTIDAAALTVDVSIKIGDHTMDKSYPMASTVKVGALEDAVGQPVLLQFARDGKTVKEVETGPADADTDFAWLSMFDDNGEFMFDDKGESFLWKIDGVVDGGKHVVEVRQDAVSRIVMSLPAVSRSVEVEFTAVDAATARMSSPQKRTLKQGHLHVVPKGIKQVTPSEDGGILILEWEDPVRVDRLQLLNIDRSGGTVTAFDIDGEEMLKRKLPSRGENSAFTFEFKTLSDEGKIRIGQQDVARLEIELPCGAALAELDFAWSGRIRSGWQRQNPRLARWFYNPITAALAKPEIQYSIKLSLISCTITAIVSLWVAIPIGYLLSRYQFFGRNLLDAVLDIPIVLPPLVVGISLLILFQFMPTWIRENVVYEIPAVILAQFAVACAFAVRTMRATFDQIDARREQVALTLGCSRAQAFGMVVLPEAWRGILTAGTLAWARSLGEFGPLLIFAGATRNKTEVLSTTVFLELSIGDLGAAVAVSLIMVVAAVIVLVVARLWGTRSLSV